MADKTKTAPAASAAAADGAGAAAVEDNDSAPPPQKKARHEAIGSKYLGLRLSDLCGHFYCCIEEYVAAALAV